MSGELKNTLKYRPDCDFQLWEHDSCFAGRMLSEVKAEFHDMKLGESRMLSETIWIIRVKA